MLCRAITAASRRGVNKYASVRFMSTPPKPISPLDSFPDISFLTQLTPEQLQPIRKLLDENIALREQLRNAQALSRAQAAIAEKAGLANELKQVHEAVSAGEAPKTPPKPEVLPPRVTAAVLKRNKQKDMLLMLLVTMLFVQGIIVYKNEHISQRDLAKNKAIAEDNEKLLSAALDSLEQVKSLAANEKAAEAKKIVDSIKEKVRLYRLKEASIEK